MKVRICQNLLQNFYGMDQVVEGNSLCRVCVDLINCIPNAKTILMSYAGHVIDMIKRLENNRILQKNLRKRLGNKLEAYAAKTAHREFNKDLFHQQTAQEQERRRKRIQSEIKSGQMAAWIKGMIALLVFILLGIVLILLIRVN